MGQPFIIYTGTKGLNIKVDPTRAKYDPETGIADLIETTNVEVSPSDRIEMQRGNEQIVAGNFHSMCPFDCGGYTLIVKGTTLESITTAGDETVIRTGLTSNARVHYVMANDGLRNKIFYVNGYERGCVYDHVNHAWNVTAYVGKDRVETPKDPPDGAHLICLFNGRIYVAVNNIIYGSDHWDFYKFWMADNGMMFPGYITMMRPVKDGIYVSAGNETVFLAGQDMSPLGEWEPFSYIKKLDSYVVSGAYDFVNGQRVGLEDSGAGILCYGPEGVFFGGPGGNFENLTINTLTSKDGPNYLPDGVYGSGIVVDNEKFILTVEP